jgi:hypothetical protein
VLSEDAQAIQSVLQQCNEFEEDKVLDAIRYLADNGVLHLDEGNRVGWKGHKKSRH